MAESSTPGGPTPPATPSSPEENNALLLKQMGDMMQALQKMMALFSGAEEPGTPASSPPGGAKAAGVDGGAIGEALGGGEFGKMLGQVIDNEFGEKLTQALKGQNGEALKQKLSESIQKLMDQQKSNKAAIAQTLLDASEKLKGLLERPRGSDLRETARMLGDILGEALGKIQQLASKNPVRQLGETTAQLLENGGR
ncbi:hypothetical protein [Cystobacter ferrugineus]|uniref:Uncharacterized protein n=1 Tax=Cystobacter ferrugineus TaxID=83449 RepID=A0A1L9BG39_9BACT|nr:hypothetical protein [Cystobacter ferrugineus]OJH41220.1 hypothetical protein BON30_10085 [Cystobacter ferrugineus]